MLVLAFLCRFVACCWFGLSVVVMLLVFGKFCLFCGLVLGLFAYLIAAFGLLFVWFACLLARLFWVFMWWFVVLCCDFAGYCGFGFDCWVCVVGVVLLRCGCLFVRAAVVLYYCLC